MPEFALTTSTFGKYTPPDSGARSLNGSYGSFIMCGAMVNGPIEPSSSIDPSVGPLATCWCAMLPPAPALLSTITVWPMFSPSFFAIKRAAASAAPPAAKPTTIVTAFFGGKSWADAAPASTRPAAASAVTRSSCRLFMKVSRIVGRGDGGW